MDSSVNVRVAVRCRPLSSKEIARGCKSIVDINANHVAITSSSNGSEEKDKKFTFDYAYDVQSIQETVFLDLGGPLIDQALKGYNGTIFAYGQTGSGKTHTMMGNDKDVGIIPRINEYLFNEVETKLAHHDSETEPGETKFMITVSFLEIYNEIVKDLLNPIGKSLNIRESPDKGIYVEGLFELIVHSASELMALIRQGNAVRKVAATNMNEQSSRSHSCLTIKIIQKTVLQLEESVQREKTIKATINLVDLAGSERASKTGATGATLKEGTNINLSLMTLGTVINKLSEGGKTHIPYRDSKLTRLLQESLGGNSATVMIAAISPADYNFDETFGTLKYANRAKSISNALVVNEDQTDRMIRNLKEEIAKLKEQLMNGGNGNGNSSPDPELTKKLREMEASQRNAWDELEQLSQKLQEERKKNMSTAITERMKEIKEEKIIRMKNIKRLQNEKVILTKRFKNNKAANVKLKSKLDADMEIYAALELKFSTASEEESEKVVDDMQKLLESIELGRSEWTTRNVELKSDKLRLTEIDDLLTEERGELVATANILDEDDKLRTSIQEEERAKAKLLIDKEIEAAKQQLDVERVRIRGSLEAEVADQLDEMKSKLTSLNAEVSELKDENSELRRRNEAFKEYNNELVDKLSDVELEKEAIIEEREGLGLINRGLVKQLGDCNDVMKAQQLELEELKKRLEIRDSLGNQNGILPAETRNDEEKYEMFSRLMTRFESERADLIAKNNNLQKLLRSATNDILYLSKLNENMGEALTTATNWEAGILPSIHRKNRNGTSSGNDCIIGHKSK